METRTAVCLLTLLLAAPVLGAELPLTERAVLTAPDAMPLDLLGLGVALSRNGGTALAGASQARCAAGLDCGAVYAYFGGGGSWGLSGKLTAPNAAQLDQFGRTIALSADGSTALIGAPGKSCCGAAYIFTRIGGTWSPAAELTAADTPAGAAFGSSVTLSADGTTAVIGAPNAGCPAGVSCGAAYVFTGGGASWTQTARLTPLDLASGDNFGAAVALSADATTALIGKPSDPCGAGFGCGAAYLFMGSGASWTQIKKLTADDPQDHSDFGWSVALSQDGAYALVGRPFFDCVAGQDCGTAHVFTRATSYSQVARLAPADSSFNEFGFSVALTDDAGTALVGSPGAPCGSDACGAAYLFSNTAGVWSQSQELTAAAPVLGSSLGISVALTNDAETALAGANFDPCPAGVNGQACGAAHVFAPLALIAVPALGPVGMGVLAVLLAGMGVVLLRRRRAV